MLIWAAAFPVIKIGVDAIGVFEVALWRHVAASILLIAYLIISRVGWRIERRDRGMFAAVAFSMVPLYHLGLNYGETQISAGAASLIVAMAPLMVALVAPFVLKEPFTVLRTIGILLALGGVGFVIVSENGGFDMRHVVGALATFLAPLTAAFNTLASKRLLARYGAFPYTAYVLIIGTAMLIPIALVIHPVRLFTSGSAGVLTVLYLGVVSNFVAYMLWFWALKQKQASQAVVYLYFIPLFANLISIGFLGQRLTWMLVAGGTLILAGVVMANRPSPVAVPED